MNAAARRNAARRGWPRGLYEPRPGYFVWKDPRDGQTHPIGRVPLAHAKAEANAANLHVQGIAPTLVERLEGSGQTVADLLGKMPAAAKANTVKSLRSLDKAIKAAVGAVHCGDLTTDKLATFVEGVEETGRARLAQALRSRLVAVCARGQQLGWLESNPAEPLRKALVTVKRGRLTLDTYRAIRARADEVNGWLGKAMDLALVTGADRITVAGMTRKMIDGEWMEYERSKTGIRLRVPLHLELVAAGLLLRDLVRNTTGIASPWLVHHTRSWGNAPKGARVFQDNMSKAFTAARKLAGMPDAGAPTFHEIRSLAKRLYETQGNVDTRWLLGHKDERTAAKYADPRGVEAVVVSVRPILASEREVNTK